MSFSLLLIDPQIDFCSPSGALYVPGAEQDMKRLAELIEARSDEISSIHITLDSHHFYHIANPVFWISQEGSHPEPFTVISAKEVSAGRWRASNEEHCEAAERYVTQLERNGRFQLVIWPPHCVLGTPGHAVDPGLMSALQHWEAGGRQVDFILKGGYALSEHYSAFSADVANPEVTETLFNSPLLKRLLHGGQVLIGGEARTHCVVSTLRDMSGELSNDELRRFVLLEDATSNIPGFEAQADTLYKELIARGLGTAKTTDFINR